MVDVIGELSAAEGRAWSRLPYMSAEVRDSLRGLVNKSINGKS